MQQKLAIWISTAKIRQIILAFSVYVHLRPFTSVFFRFRPFSSDKSRNLFSVKGFKVDCHAPILSDNTPRLSVNSPKVFCNTPKVLKNALAAFFLSRLVLFSQFFRLSALYFKIIAYICTCNPKGKQRHIARFRTLVHIAQIYRAKL